MNSKKRREFVRSYKPYKCDICLNTGEWNNKSLSLQVDHIDGNSSNDNIENLRFLCPNCHSQTDTFTGRNAKTKHFNKPSKEEFLELLSKFTIKEISIVKAVSLRTAYQWFKYYIKERKETLPRFNRKLTCAQVSEIISSTVKSERLALEYNVTGKTIRSIRSFEIYKDCN